MKIVFAGKGGVGKTTLCSLMALTWDTLGYKVLAIDADPDANLASALGVVQDNPLAKDREFLRSIAGIDDTALSGFYILNSFVDNVIERFAQSFGKQSHIISLGWSKQGGEGCYCTENTALRSIIRSIPNERYDLILIDGEAGLEHLSRGVSAKADVLVCVFQAGQRSIQTVHDAKKLAADLDIKAVLPMLCGYKSEQEAVFMEEKLGEAIAFKVPYLECIREADIESKKVELPTFWQESFIHFVKKLSTVGSL